MNTALIPGTFDPPTLGHADIILRAAKLAKTLIIGVATNSLKQKYTFTVEERIELLEAIVPPNARIVHIEGLVVDYIKEQPVDIIIRGLRSCAELEKERQMAFANKKMGGPETLFLMADARFEHISSTLLREIASGGHSLIEFIPSAIVHKVEQRFRSISR